MFKVEIEAETEAFDRDFPELEVARILREVADKIVKGQCKGLCRDRNGNKVGFYDWTA